MKRTDFIGQRNNRQSRNLVRYVYRFRVFLLAIVLIIGYYYYFSHFVEHLEKQEKRIDLAGIKKKREEVFENVNQIIPNLHPDMSNEPTVESYIDLETHNIEPTVTQNSNKKAKDTTLEVVIHNVYKSTSKRFFAIDAFMFDGDKDRPSFSAKTEDYIIVILGIGEFTPQPNHRAKDVDGVTPKEIPNLVLNFVSSTEDIDINLPLLVHTNGTYFQKKFDRYNNRKYSGEKGVWLTAVLPKQIVQALEELTEYKSEIGKVTVYSDDQSLVFKNHPFKLPGISIYNYIAPTIAENTLTLCTSAIYNARGYRYLLEYILYHKIVGFDKLHLYFFSRKYLLKLQDLLNVFSDDIVVHDWSHLPNNDIPSVKILNYEHAQRLTRNDCFFRNRGISKYIAFSDLDELFVPNYFDLEYDSVLALKKLVYAIENKEVGSYLSSSRFQGINKIVHYMDTIYSKDPLKVAFQFTSITVPPVDVEDQNFPPEDLVSLPNLNIVSFDQSDNFNGFLRSMAVAETKCTVPYNCGKFHEGRQKYMLRVAKGSVNPNNPLFYHAVSEEYASISSYLTVQVPTTIGYLRHFAGHFKTSRFGGLPLDNRKIMGLPYFVLKGMKDVIEKTEVLNKFYFDHENDIENFLKLGDFHNLNRFIKPIDENYELTNLILPKSDPKYLTFDRYGGRLNNQLFTLDWAFRLSKAFKRTLYLSEPLRPMHYVGLPQTKAEEDHQSAIWNTSLLRANFNFIMYYEIKELSDSVRSLLELNPSELPQKCVWEYKRNDKILPDFLSRINMDSDCTRVHFMTSQGLIHPKRSDTRKYGVGPLYFWSSLLPNSYITRLTTSFVNDVRVRNKKLLIGFHSRHFDTSIDPNVCKRLAEKTITSAKNYVESFRTCCKRPKPMFNHKLHEYDSTFMDFNFAHYRMVLKYSEMCDIPESYLNMFDLQNSEKYSLIVGQDNRSERVYSMFKRYGAVSFTQAKAIHENRPPHAVNHRIRSTIESVLGDMLSLKEVDFFHGSGASTLTQVICFLRLSEAKRRGLEERSNVCHLALLSTGSYTCDSMCCSSTDIKTPALFNLAN